MKIHHSRGLLFESEMRSRPSHSRSICDGDSETSRLGKKLQGVMVVSAYALFHILLLNP